MKRLCYMLAGLTLAGCSENADFETARTNTPSASGWDNIDSKKEDRAKNNRPSQRNDWLPRTEKKLNANIARRRPTRRVVAAPAAKPQQQKNEPPVAKAPAVKKPVTKRVAAIDWHTSLNAALGEASRPKPAGGKPVMCYRVLGDMTGFM